MKARAEMPHLTWSCAAYDPPGTELPRGLILPGRPLTFQIAGCFDCDWVAHTKSYADISDARERHQVSTTLAHLPIPAMRSEVMREEVAA